MTIHTRGKKMMKVAIITMVILAPLVGILLGDRYFHGRSILEPEPLEIED